MPPLPFPVFTRNRYFTGKLLDEKDLTEEQDYVVGKDRLLNRARHGWGIVDGLEVEPGHGDAGITVGPGVAIDGWGREIVLPTSLPLTMPPGAGWVTIRVGYVEFDADPLPMPGEETPPMFGTVIEGYTVWTEPGLPPSPPPDSDPSTLPSDPSVVLATIRRSSKRPHLHIDTTTHRREIPSNAKLLEMVQRLEARLARLLGERNPTEPSP